MKAAKNDENNNSKSERLLGLPNWLPFSKRDTQYGTLGIEKGDPIIRRRE